MKKITPSYQTILTDVNTPHEISYDASGNLLSIFSDNIWNLTNYIKNKNVSRSRKIIDFNVKLCNETILTDKENLIYLRGIKEYLYTRYFIPHPKSGKILKPQSLISHFDCYITLINFLIAKSLPKISEFRPIHTKQFLLFIKDRNPNISGNTVVKYLSIIADIYFFREKLTDSLLQHPWPESSAIYLSEARKNNGLRLEKQTPCIPDYICSKLMQNAVKFIEQNSPRIINATKELEEHIEIEFTNALKNKKQYKSVFTQRPDINALYAAKRSYRYHRFKKDILEKHGFKSSRELTSCTNMARTCCYVIIALLTGMRNSEISSLKKGCLAKSIGWDDEEYLWLHGYTYKLEDEPKPARWMVPEIVSIAVEHLESMTIVHNNAILRFIPHLTLNEQYSQKEILEHLFVCRDFKSNTYNCVSNSHWNKVLSELANKFELHISEISKELLLLPGDVYPLSSHMFRRTFAVLAARSALGDLRYLREHFKHISIDMTLYYANHSGYDDTLFDEILTERNDIQRAIVSDWIVNEQPLTGGRGEAIVTFRQRGQLKTAKDQKQLLNQISDSVYVRGTALFHLRVGEYFHAAK